ncbi:hypothetical protein [Engelhardtia mirabilis]|uniref:DUF1579 domain-containing protein n=1 Tax=Engelhardtia mirabilis TaxID=2528011 RepID=A0A518BQQ3_9BACT|nr:hypothetical protein Pla133_44230 [Planctomycetes bacterium Pla133]QDV03630.1 hypothetical protein Pla86_44210 [Planctomycetes bacterium Pla86]
MLQILLALALANSIHAPQGAANTPPPRQFDFWIGEWAVHNRHLQEDGTWSEGEDTRARITPVCDGAAILEEWCGPWYGSFQNGFSLRAFDPTTERWKLVLFWTTTGRGAFGSLGGRFRHGRGEFFAGSPRGTWTRYSFSDALANSTRWDSATSVDGGQSWKTDWIMEFTRTRTAGEVTQERLFEEDWNAGQVAPDAAARELDWTLGEWKGLAVRRDGGGEVELQARLRVRLLNKDALVLGVLELDRGDEHEERLAVRGFEAGAGAWRTWRLESDDPVLRTAQPEEGATGPTAWTYRLDEAGQTLRVRVERLGEGRMRRTETVADSSGEVVEELVVELERG